MDLKDVRISPLDRGFLFGDSIYEVVPVFNGHRLLGDEHLERLSDGLAEARIPDPLSRSQWEELISELIQRNGGGDMGVYIQVTRGADLFRDHVIPDVRPTVFSMASRIDSLDVEAPSVKAVTRSDIRWHRCDIKTTSLMANILLRDEAQRAGAEETILIRDGLLTEGASSSVMLVDVTGVVAPPETRALLPGTTRGLMIRLLTQAQIPWREENVSEAQLRAADEIWILSAGRGVLPVVQLDGAAVGSGEAGPMWRKAHQIFREYVAKLG